MHKIFYIVDGKREGEPGPSCGIAPNKTTDLPLLLRLIDFIGDGITEDIPSSKNSSKPMTLVPGLPLLLLLLLPFDLLLPPGPAVLGLPPFPPFPLLGRCPLAFMSRFLAACFLFSEGVLNLFAATLCAIGCH